MDLDALATKISAGTANEKERGQWNAVAWLSLTDPELIERSASLGLDPELHPYEGEATGRLARQSELDQLRANADAVAVGHSSKAFVASWIKENRPEPETDPEVLYR